MRNAAKNTALKIYLSQVKHKKLQDISCGHTTDFYPGKTNLPRANSSKISRDRFISGFVQYLGKNSGKVTLLTSAPKVFTPVEFFGA